MDQTALMGLIDLAFDRWTLLIAGGIYLFLRTLNGFEPISKLGVYRRILPLLPESLGVAAAFLGGIPFVEGKPAVIKIAAGLWCAYLAQRFRKLLGQTVLGDDAKLEAARKKGKS